MENKEFAEKNAGKNFTYKGKYKARLVGYNKYTGLFIVSGLPFGWGVLSLYDGDVLLVQLGSMHDTFYYVKPSDLVPYVEKNKEFAEKNAGKYFLYRGVKVRVVGYCAESYKMVLVSLTDHIHTFGWGRSQLDLGDVFTFPSNDGRFWYVEIEQLK